MDNAPSHPTDVEYSNVTVRFFPPNTTSHLQPLDQGVIRAFKAHYRRLVLERLLSVMDNIQSADEITKKISVLDAVGWIDLAWCNLSSSCIYNCFLKAGFLPGPSQDEVIEDEDGEMVTLSEFLARYKSATSAIGVVDANEFVTFDDNVETVEHLGETADDIANAVWQKHMQQDVEIESDGDGESDDVVILEDSSVSNERPPVTDKEMMSCFASLKEYCMQKEPDLFSKVFELESLFTSACVKRKLQNSHQVALDTFLLKE